MRTTFVSLTVASALSTAPVMLLRRATALGDGMPPEFGPPAVVAPSHELLGAMLLANNRADEAAGQYAKALEIQPGRTAALLGSARADVARGRTAEAARTYRLLADNWSAADATLPALSGARRRGARQ